MPIPYILVRMGFPAMGPKVSVILCTYQRPESLKRCLKSLSEQDYENYEVKIVGEKGELAALRNKGTAGAKGEYLIFIDDDTVLTPHWMSGIVRAFQENPRVGGVSGPAVILLQYQQQRDIFRFKHIKRLYDLLFLYPKSALPGHITSAGAWTTGAAAEDCSYEGEVDFLEACNMAWSKEAFREVGGFDESYRGIGDWSEPDLAFRVRERGYLLHFSPEAKLYHLPDRTGAYLSRAQTGARYTNYIRFARRWVHPCWRHSLYKGFLRGYFTFKEGSQWLTLSGWKRRLMGFLR